MRTTIEQRTPDLEKRLVRSFDLRAALEAVLAIHALEDPRRFPDVLLSACERLLPADHVDATELRAAWADRSERDREPGVIAPPCSPVPSQPRISADGHRLELLASASRRIFGILLERYVQPFDARAVALAAALQPHIGPAFDHARLRAAERAVLDTIGGLTVREQEVLALVADGRTNRDIGLALFIEPRTVEKHVEHIRTKLGARSRADAAAKWARCMAVPFA